MSLQSALAQHGLMLDGTAANLRTYAKQGKLVIPSPLTGFWSGCPNLNHNDPQSFYSLFDDFFAIAKDATTGLPTFYSGALENSGTIACVAGAVGGQLALATGTTDENGMNIQFGADAFRITKDSGKKLWAEFRVKIGSHANIAGAFVGLAGTGYDWDILTDNTGVLVDNKNLVGFNILAATPTAWNATWKTGTKTAGVITGAAVNADDYHTFGIRFDGVSTVSFYIDGALNATSVEVDADAFPEGSTDGKLAPFACVKTNTTAATTLTLDWIKLVQYR